MKRLTLLLFALPALAAIDGTVTNRTTGKPVAGATVSVVNLAQGMQPAATAKTGAGGAFSIDIGVTGPVLLQTTHGGISYSKMLQLGAPLSGVALDVYDVSSKPGQAAVAQRMLLFEPGNEQLQVTEIFLFQNPGATTWRDPGKGTLRFYLPPAAQGAVKVNATAPHGMPLAREAEKAGGDVYKVDFPIKPGGETRIDVSYSVHYHAGGTFEGKLVTPAKVTRLFAPIGVTLEGEGVAAAGQDPNMKANIYTVAGETFKISVSMPEATAGESGPRFEPIMPRLYGRAPVIVALAAAILLLGFVLLYRARPGGA